MVNAQQVVCFRASDDTSARIQVSIVTGYLCDLLPHESNNKAGAEDALVTDAGKGCVKTENYIPEAERRGKPTGKNVMSVLFL